MSHAAPQGGVGASSGAAQVEYACERMSKAKVRVSARVHGKLAHFNAYDLDSATARTKFAATLAQKIEKDGLETIDVQAVEDDLLHLVDEADQGDGEAGSHQDEYEVVMDNPNPERNGIYRNSATGPIQLSNFAMAIERDVAVHDGEGIGRRYEGRIILNGVASDFSVTPEEYNGGNKLAIAIHQSAGAKARILCKPEVLCRAVYALSSPIPTTITTDFGWTEKGDAYRAPSVAIDASGICPVGPADPAQVDLGDEQCARHLDLASLPPAELAEVKAHVAADLLRLNDRKVTFVLLAAVAMAVLIRFAPGMNRPAIWLTGLTGGGKSFLGRLFANFFGDFPPGDGSRGASWTSTANFIQRQGYFFKDATYLVDDFKPDLIQHREVVKLLQNYADNSARGRLKADATTKVSRPIRGILISTGEDVPEHSASSVARTIIVPVPQSAKDIDRGLRCVAQRPRYRAVTAALIRHLIVGGRTAGFAARVEAEVKSFYDGIAGQQNDVRIAGNFALLMASFMEFAEFLGDDWPGWQEEAVHFRGDLLVIRDEMLGEVRDRQDSEVFLSTLRALLTNDQLRINGWGSCPGSRSKGVERPLIGRVVATNPTEGPALEICASLALGAVQESLR